MHIKSHPNSPFILTINTRRNPIDPPPNSPKHPQTMDKLCQTVLNLATSKVTHSLAPSQISALQNRLLDIFSSLKTPTHPTYSSMILDAIKELNKKGRSTTKEMILENIIENNKGLPWAHKRYLEHHLCKLCESGELNYDSDGSYNSPDTMRRKRSRKLLRRSVVSAVKGDVDEDVMQELNDSHVGFQEDACEELGRGKRKRKHKRSFVFDDEDEEEGVETRVALKEVNVETRNGVLLLESSRECRSVDCVDFTAGRVESKLDVEHPKEANGLVEHEISEGVKGSENVVTIPVPQGEVMKSNDGNVGSLVAPLVSVSDIEMIDAAGIAVEKSVLKETKPNPCDNELMIVPYVGNLENSVVGKAIIPLLESKGAAIVCGLFCEKSEIPKKKRLAYLQRRRRSKSTPEKAKASDSSGQRSLETKLKRKSQSPKSKGVTLREDGSAKLGSTHPSHLESISMEDEETLTQLIQKCGHRKKHGMPGIFKDASPLASSKAGNQLPKEPPSLEMSVDLAPTVEKESASTNGTEKQFHVRVSMPNKKCDDVEVNVIRKPSSSFSVEAGTKSLEGPDNQQPIISNSTTSCHTCQPDFDDVKHQERQTQLSHDLQCALGGGSQSIVEGPEVQCLEEPSKPKETADGFITPSLLVELRQQEVGPSEPTGSQSIVEGLEVQCLEESSKPKETTDGLITPSLLVELHQQEVETSEPMGSQSIVEGPKVQCLDESSKPKETTDGLITPSLLVELHQQQVGPSESTGSQSIVEGPKVQCLDESSKPKETTDGLITPSLLVELYQQQVGPSESTGSQSIVEGPKVQCLEESAKSKETTDGLITSSLLVELHQQQVGPFEPTGSQNVNKGPKVQCPEKSSKPKEITDGFVTPLLLPKLHQQEVGPSEQTGHCGSDNQQSELIIKPIRAGSSSQLSELLREDNEEHSQHEVRHEVLEPPIAMFVNAKIHVSDQFPHQENKDDQERPLKLTEATPEDEVCSSGFKNGMWEGLSELTSQQRSHQLNEQLENSQLQKRGRGRPRKSNKPTVQDAADSAIQPSQQNFFLLKYNGKVRTRNQISAMKDAGDVSEPYLKEQEQLSETETPQHLPNENTELEIVSQMITSNSKEVSAETMDSKGRCKKDMSEPSPRPRGRPKKEKNNNSAKDLPSQHHNKKEKRGRPRLQKANKNDVDFMSSSQQQSHQNFGSQTRQQQDSRKAQSPEKGVTKGGSAPSYLRCPEEGDIKLSSHAVPEASSTQSPVDLKESLPAASDHVSCPDSAVSAVAFSDASTYFPHQSSQQGKDWNHPRRRSTRNSETPKTILNSQDDKQHDLNLSIHHFVAKESLDSENEVHDKPIGMKQTELPLDNKIPLEGRLPPSVPVTRPSNNQHDQGQQPESYDHDQSCEKMENHLKLPKITSKAVPVHVPLSSKDQLRSRFKHQS
ncbi:hypothetical protein vseg_017695 [Gypsophila vaccaria]